MPALVVTGVAPAGAYNTFVPPLITSLVMVSSVLPLWSPKSTTASVRLLSIAVSSNTSESEIQSPYCFTFAVTVVTLILFGSGVTPSVSAVSAFGSVL